MYFHWNTIEAELSVKYLIFIEVKASFAGRGISEFSALTYLRLLLAWDKRIFLRLIKRLLGGKKAEYRKTFTVLVCLIWFVFISMCFKFNFWEKNIDSRNYASFSALDVVRPFLWKAWISEKPTGSIHEESTIIFITPLINKPPSPAYCKSAPIASDVNSMVSSL